MIEAGRPLQWGDCAMVGGKLGEKKFVSREIFQGGSNYASQTHPGGSTAQEQNLFIILKFISGHTEQFWRG